MADPVRYRSSVTVRCPPEVRAAIDEAARQRGMKPAEYHRQALLMGLRLDGFDPVVAAKELG